MKHTNILPRIYTKDDWTTDRRKHGVNSEGVMIDNKSGAIAFCLGHRTPESIANATLITAAPIMDATLEHVYLQLQVLVQKQVRLGLIGLSVETDSLRATLRNTICEANGFDTQTYQDAVEAEANRLVRDRLARP